MGFPYETYDRQRPSRRADSFKKPRDQKKHEIAGFARPGTATPDEGRASGSGSGSGSDARRPYRRSYDPRDYPPPPPPDTGPPRRQRHSPIRSRRSWPPPPSCEDETASLAKEAGGHVLLRDMGKNDIPSRGSIDQEPIMQEVPEFVNLHERRYVIVSASDNEGNSTRVPARPPGADDRARKMRRRPSKINTGLDKGSVPELAKRAASPYAFSNSIPLKDDVSSGDRFLSPDTLAPPQADSGRKQSRFSASPASSSPRRDSVRESTFAKESFRGGGSSSGENAIVDDDSDGRWTPKITPKRPDLRRSSPRTSTIDYAPPNADNAACMGKLNVDLRGKEDTNSTTTLPKTHAEKPRRPSPLASNAVSERDEYAIPSSPGTPGSTDFRHRPRRSSGVSSLGTPSAASMVSAGSASVIMSRADRSPSQSPGLGAEPSQKRPANLPLSGSISSSRPSSPPPYTPGDSPRLPRTDLDWSALLAANAALRSKTSPRVNQPLRQSTNPEITRVFSSSIPTRHSSLPYPVDDDPDTPSVAMPSEREHQYFPSMPFTSESKTLSRGVSPAAKAATRATATSSSSRPPLRSHHSASNGSPTDERPRAALASSQTKKELTMMLKRGLPDCQRPNAVEGYDDWYTIIGAPHVTFCPNCVDFVFDRTIFRPHIRRMPQLNVSQRVGCAFGSAPWICLAWQLTLQQQRMDLTLMKDIAEVEGTSEPCPGDREAVRTWYGLRDTEGLFVRDFYICYADVRKIERLLPTLNGFFVPLPHRASYGKHICTVRTKSNRFSVYLETLINIHEKALSSRKPADPMPFIDLVERKMRLRECTKDLMLRGGRWYFIPGMQEFTVCEDCYDAVVEPEVKKRSDVAMHFNQTMKQVHGEGMGSSCQLYSRRMRQAFQRAVEDNDMKYLARKATDRREAELRLQERYKEVIRKYKRLKIEGGATEDDERRLDRERQRITNEWQAKWE